MVSSRIALPTPTQYVEFVVDDANHLVNVLDEDGCRFQMIPHVNRNAIERIFWK